MLHDTRVGYRVTSASAIACPPNESSSSASNRTSCPRSASPAMTDSKFLR